MAWLWINTFEEQKRVSGTIYDNGTMRASPPTQSIPQLVKSLKILITKEIGFSLFQRSYHDHIIRNEKEYKQIWEYIDTNPLKWEEDKYIISNYNQ